MAKAYKSILNQHKCRWWLERDGDNYNVPIRLVVHSEEGPGRDKAFITPDLSTYEIGALATHFARVYFERTGKVVWPVAGSMLHTYEKAQLDAADEQYKWMQASPVTEIQRMAATFAAEAGLEVDPLDDDPLEDSTPRTRYFWHPKLRTLTVTDDGRRPICDDADMEEIAGDQYDALAAELSEEAKPSEAVDCPFCDGNCTGECL